MDSKVEMQRQAIEACLRRLWASTVAVVNGVRVVGWDPLDPDKRADGEEFGSGLAASWGKHHFILTAKHVLTNAKPSDLRIFWCPGGVIEKRAPSELRKEDVVNADPLGEADAAISRCEWDDLALLSVPPGAIGPHAEFVDVEKEWIDPPPGDRVHCFGFPSDSNFVWETKVVGGKTERLLAIYPGNFEGEVKDTPSFLTNSFDSGMHYLIPFDDAAIGKHPQGYSGAAAWWESDQPQRIWRPTFRFAGICTSCYKNGSFEKVIKASVVRRFIEEVFGGANFRLDR